MGGGRGQASLEGLDQVKGMVLAHVVPSGEAEAGKYARYKTGRLCVCVCEDAVKVPPIVRYRHSTQANKRSSSLCHTMQHSATQHKTIRGIYTQYIHYPIFCIVL